MPSNTAAIEDSGVTLVSAEQRQDLIPAFAELNSPTWPKFLGGDEAIIECWDSLFTDGLSRYQFAAVRVDEQGEERVLAASNSIPFVWPRPDDHVSLPDGGWDEVLRGGVDALSARRKANALSALAIVVSPELRGSDLAERLLRNMKACAIKNGLQALVAPVRPTKKMMYPLASLGDYMDWTTADGAPFDPWVRKHWKLGAQIVKIAPCSMTVSAPLSQWTEWTGLRFPVSGSYHVEGGLAPMIADCTDGTGLYEEPNIWLRHPL